MFDSRLIWAGLLVVPLLLAGSPVRGQAAPPPGGLEEVKAPPLDPETRRRAEVEQMRRLLQATAARLQKAGVKYLLAAQEKDGGWASQTGPGISSLALKALIQAPDVGPKHAAVQRGLKFVLGFQQEDGGVYNPEGLHQNYESSVALSMLAALDSEQYQPHIKKLQDFLRRGQWDESEDKDPNDPWYGGAGYGRHKRPDLSNTQMMLEALRDSGVPADDPAYRKALVFIQRCQMHGELNEMAYAEGSTEGGFIYSPANGGESKAGTIEVAGKEQLRCFGTMTYAGLKSMLYADLAKDDPRVLAAVEWIGRHWTLDFNPNMPAQQSKEGLFYYYHVFSRTWATWGVHTITDAQGDVHNWRMELVGALRLRQREDGSWVNAADRYMEGIPPLTTAYALLSLQAAFPPEAGK